MKNKITPSVGAHWHGVWQKGRIEPNRRLYDFELVWFSSGRGRVIIDKEEYACFPGSVIIIPPETVHCTVADTNVERWCIHFDWFGDCRFHQDPPEAESYFVYDDPADNRYIREYAAAVPNLPCVAFPHFCRTVPQEIYKYIREFFTVCNKDCIAAAGFFMLALSGILNSGTHKSSPVSILLKAKSLIDREFSDVDMCAGSIAENCNISVNHLNRLFQTSLGVTTTNYIQSRRLEYACSLLSGSTMAIKEIAVACGFNDHNYFTRLFKAKKGITPGEMRRAMGDLLE